MKYFLFIVIINTEYLSTRPNLDFNIFHKALNHLSLVEAGSEVEAYVKKHAIKSSSAADIQNDGVNNNAKNAQLNPNNDQISKEVKTLIYKYFNLYCQCYITF